jgi:class 3 adenylate cyclase/pimeloyl-ACP methyl ester carboxylesterase
LNVVEGKDVGQLGQRRLAAILAADVAGYTRLIEQDTEGTIRAWKVARDDVIKPLVNDMSGRIIKFTGDGFLVEFPSVQDSVACAIALQTKLSSSTLNFRMGINVGDITDDGGDVHGEGVNIAARLEPLADPGGICISGDVHNQVHNRVDAVFKDMGEHDVKHVTRPIRVWKIVTDRVAEVLTETPKTEFEQEIRYCTSQDGTALAYASVGQGPPILKAPNFMAHLEHEWSSPAFEFYRAWAEQNRFIRFDQRGNGLSDRHPGEITFDSFVQDLEAVADASGLERFPILAMSQGAAVAIAYAVKHPERVSALILIGGFGRGLMAARNQAEETRTNFEAQLNLMRTGWGLNTSTFRQMFTSMYIPGAEPDAWDSFNELMRVATAPETAAHILSVNAHIDVIDILKDVQAPTLILHARDDAVIPFEAGRKLATKIPNAKLIALESINHIPLMSDPTTERILLESRKFLSENPA